MSLLQHNQQLEYKVTKISISTQRCRDKSEEEYQKYLQEMPWWSYALQRQENDMLASLVSVSTIPNLTLVDTSSGDIITAKAADMLRAEPTGADFPYRPKPIERLSPMVGPTLNAAPCCFAIVDSKRSRHGMSEAHEIMHWTAKEEFLNGGPGRIHFFLGSSSDTFVQQLMQVRGLLQQSFRAFTLPGCLVAIAMSTFCCGASEM